MTLKEIKNHYRLHKYDEFKNQFLVYSNIPGSCSRMVYKFLCVIKRDGNKFSVENFNPTNKIDELKKQIQTFTDSLPYDSMYYNPNFITGLKEELIIHDYLLSLNFISEGDSNYRLKTKNAYNYCATNVVISFSGLDAIRSGKILDDKINIYVFVSGSSWVTVKTDREVEAIKKGIDTLLKPLLVSESVNNYLI